MYKFIVILLFSFPCLNLFAQRIVFDRNHFDIVNENGAVRLAAENANNSYLSEINKRLGDIKLNVSSVILVQNLIYSSLSQVNNGLKSAIAVKQIGELGLEIINESSQMIEIAQSDPYLVLFAEDVARQMKDRGLKLAMDVSSFVLKEGENVLMDFEKRDALLKKISLELRVIRALVFSMKKSMYWAKMNGVLKTANPFQGFINQDSRLIDDILFKAELLKSKP